MPRQISAIVSNASSRLDFSDRRSFFFGRFGLHGSALLVVTTFDATDGFLAVAACDLRFGAMYCSLVERLQACLVCNIIANYSERSDPAICVPRCIGITNGAQDAGA